MRAFQFWTLLLCSSFVSLLYLAQISLSRDLNQKQRDLVDSQSVVNEGAAFEGAWKKLSMYIYEAAHQGGHVDQPLMDILIAEKVDVHSALTPAPGSTPSTPAPANPLPSAPGKAPTPLPMPGAE